MIQFIYILIFFILIFVAYLGLKAVGSGIKAKQRNNFSKKMKNKKKNISQDLIKLNDLYKSGAITKNEFQKAKNKILDN